MTFKQEFLIQGPLYLWWPSALSSCIVLSLEPRSIKHRIFLYMPHICLGVQAMPPTMASHEPPAHVSEFEDWTGPPALVRPRAVIAQFVLAWNESSTHVHAVEPPALDPVGLALGHARHGSSLFMISAKGARHKRNQPLQLSPLCGPSTNQQFLFWVLWAGFLHPKIWVVYRAFLAYPPTSSRSLPALPVLAGLCCHLSAPMLSYFGPSKLPAFLQCVLRVWLFPCGSMMAAALAAFITSWMRLLPTAILRLLHPLRGIRVGRGLLPRPSFPGGAGP